MSFAINQSSSSSSSSSSRTVNFTPPKVDVNWDGESVATLTLALNCTHTAATYQAFAWLVYAESGSLETTIQGQKIELPYEAGERQFGIDPFSGTKVYYGDQTITTSVVGASATILFSGLNKSNAPYGWRLRATVSGNHRVLAFGKLSVMDFNVNDRPSGSMNYVSGTTAAQCF